MDNTSQFFSNCSDLSTEDIATVNLAFCISGGACGLISILISLVLVFCRAYKSVLQRLFLYVMVTTIVRELFLAASIEHQFKYKGQEQVCTWIAFIHNWAGILKFVHTVGIMTYLFFLVRHVAKGEKTPKLLKTKSRRVVAEILYVLISFLVSLSYATVPMFTHKYGLAGSICWIRALDENCHLTLTGLLDQILSGYVFFCFWWCHWHHLVNSSRSCIQSTPSHTSRSSVTAEEDFYHNCVLSRLYYYCADDF